MSTYVLPPLFYDAFASEAPATLNSIPFRAAELIRNANRHPCFLGALGILPNQLRTLLKESGHVNREEALLDMSRTLFFAGFRVWTKKATTQLLLLEAHRTAKQENYK